LHVFGVPDAVVAEAALPDGKLRGEAVGEAAFDEAHRALECDDLRSEDQVDVVGHDDEGVEFVVAFAAVVLEGFEEELGGGGHLEETAAIVSAGRDEVRARARCSGGDRHAAILLGGASGKLTELGVSGGDFVERCRVYAACGLSDHGGAEERDLSA
jgi:hypothetical protein